MGIPQLMMGFTKDGQIDEARLRDRDRRFGASTVTLRQDRADIAMPDVQPGANAWQSGHVMQLRLEEVAVRNLR